MEHMLWHPVALAADVSHQPQAVTLLNQPLVVWREGGGEGQPDGEGVIHVWHDHCPHRGAKLSMGEVVKGPDGRFRLACPYHGWAFGSTGRCEHVPAQPDWQPPASHATTVCEVTEQQGLVWVRLSPPDDTVPDTLREPHRLPEADQPGWRNVWCGPYTVATSAPRLVENFLDMSHFGFVHRGYLGDAEHARVDSGQVQELKDENQLASGVQVHEALAWQPRGYADAAEGCPVRYRYSVPAPYAATLCKEADTEGGPSNAIGLFIQPEAHESCRAWFLMATRGDPSTDAELRAFQDTVFLQDKPIVESQTPRRLPITGLGAWREVHGPADRVSAAYRRFLTRLDVSTGIC